MYHPFMNSIVHLYQPHLTNIAHQMIKQPYSMNNNHDNLGVKCSALIAVISR